MRRKPRRGDVVPYLVDHLGPGRKFGFMEVDDLEAIDGEAWIFGRVLRRTYFDGDRIVIDDGDIWTEHLFAVPLCDVLAPIVPVYEEVWK